MGLINVRAAINRDALDGIIAQLPAGEGFVAELAADAVLEGAKERAAVRTGEMRDSGEKVGSGSSWIVVFKAAHSAFVEFGTRLMAAQPYLRPALEALRWGDIIDQFFRRIGL